MGIKHTIRHPLEYAGLRVLVWVIQIMPLRAAETLALGLGALLFRLGRRRRDIACRNILRSGIATSPAEAHRIARASVRHFAIVLVENLKGLSVFPSRPWNEFVTLDAPDETMALLRDPKQGVIAVTGHLGNWETAGWMLSSVKPVLAVARQMNNAKVEAFIQSRTSRNQFRTVPKRTRTAKPLIKALRGGDLLALLSDQHTRDGVMVDFFGSPAMTHTSPARLHLITGAPIVVGTCIRTGPMRYRITLGEPIRADAGPDRAATVLAILEQINRRLEEMIRRTPEQYLWAHRRWRDRGAA